MQQQKNLKNLKHPTSQVTSHMSRVTCHLPPVTNTNSHRPFPPDSCIINSRLDPEGSLVRFRALLPEGQIGENLSTTKYNFLQGAEGR